MSELRITHVGGPTTLLEFEGWRILTDPTFDPPGGRYFFGWGTTSRKTAGPSIPIDALGAIDAVLVSHHHRGDNLDRRGRQLLGDWGTVITTSKGAGVLGGGARGLQPWGSTTLESPGKPTITVSATPCRHGPVGTTAITGPVIGFCLSWPGQEHGQLWVTGDTVYYPGMAAVGKRFDIGTMVMHLGSVRFRYLSGWLRYTMDAREGVRLLEEVRPVNAVPVHYEGWSHFQEGRAAGERTFASSPLADRITWLDPGDAAVLTA